MCFSTAQLESFDKAAIIYRAINNPVRRKIMEIISKKPTDVTSLFIALRMDQSAVSQQLAILRRARWVIAQRDGKKIIYAPYRAMVDHYNEITKKLLTAN